MDTITQPTRLVGLHSHTNSSVYDAIGTPQEHMDFALSNGMDALAQTDHGNMNGFAKQRNHSIKLSKKGIRFKPIFGLEAYFIPSLKRWEELREETKSAKQQEQDEETTGGTSIEETDTAQVKVRDPLRQRSHLVLLAKNSAGLKSLFNIVSDSSIEGFYVYPRVDYDMLRKHAKGNIIATSACVSGFLAWIISQHQTEQGEWGSWEPNKLDFDLIQQELAREVGLFQEALGPENYYLEIQANALSFQHLVNMHMFEASKRLSVPLVITTDAHYSRPEHWKQREIYKMLGRQQKGLPVKDIPQRIEDLKCELYPKNAQQMWESYKKYCAGYDFYDDEVVKQAIERTYDIAHNQIDNNIEPDRRVKLPSFKTLVENDQTKIEQLTRELETDDEDALSFRELRNLAVEGLRKRGTTSKQHVDRLRHELEIVRDLKFSKYFLTYRKIMEIISETQLVGFGRGSGAASLLAYVLGITQLDPVKYELLFARFLTKFKSGHPDLDSDCADRDAAVKAITKWLGEENVIPVSNFAQLKPVSLIKDLSRYYNLPFDEVNASTVKMLPEVMAEKKKESGFDAQQWELTFEELERFSPTYVTFMDRTRAVVPEFEESIKVLVKQQRTLSKHAGGVILAENTRENMPLIKAKGGLQTPWPEGLSGRYLEELGFLKFDILGLGTLRMFEDCVAKILTKHHGIRHPKFQQVKQFYENLVNGEGFFEDQKVYKHVFHRGTWGGIFQFCKSNTQSFVMEMKPTSIVDLAVATSIFRPAPLALKVDKQYLANRASPESVQYKHPLLKEALGESCGLLCFQEQLQLIFHKLAGVDLEETDGIRKAFTKKDMANKAKQDTDKKNLRTDFVERCFSASQIPRQVSGEIFDDLDACSSYLFNKSHAIVYSAASYVCAWFLTYYPDEWITTYLDYSSEDKGKVSGKEDPKVTALSEARCLGYQVGKPDINTSEEGFAVVGNKTLVPSFSSLKFVGKSALSEIRENRPYTAVEDLLMNTDGSWKHSRFNKRALSTLLKLEALDSMGLVGEDKTFRHYKEAHDILVDHYDDLKRISMRKKDNDARKALRQLIDESRTKLNEDWTLEEKIQHSSDLSGTVDINLVLTPQARDRLQAMKFRSLDEYVDKGLYWGIVREAQVAKTKKGKSYLRLRMFAEQQGENYLCFVWNWSEEKNQPPEPYTLLCGLFDKSEFGFTAFSNQLKKVAG